MRTEDWAAAIMLCCGNLVTLCTWIGLSNFPGRISTGCTNAVILFEVKRCSYFTVNSRSFIFCKLYTPGILKLPNFSSVLKIFRGEGTRKHYVMLTQIQWWSKCWYIVCNRLMLYFYDEKFTITDPLNPCINHKTSYANWKSCLNETYSKSPHRWTFVWCI